jgi:aminopeptidase N
MRCYFAFLACIALGTASGAPSFKAPKLRLGDAAAPSRYAVDLTIVPDRNSFEGTVDISMVVHAATRLIWLNATALEIKQATFQPAGAAAAQNVRIVPGGGDFAGFYFDHPVSGQGVLHVLYEGKISRRSSAGIFELKEGGQWYVYTQFEPTDARRAFPCFDEPSFKVPWQITLHVPKEDVAAANTPILSEQKESGGMKMVTFKPSPPLSSYLVAFAVGRFDIVDAGRVGATPLRILVPKGKAAQAAYAAAAIPQLLKLVENYVGLPFPYEKLDSVVMPISDFAMENAGLITYDESTLLADPRNDTINRQREMATFCAHEMSHQWFGDLVTTAWWNDIWLNEAFATWMETKIVGEWKPQWHMDVSAVNARLGAMHQDSLTSAREIRQPIETNDDIANSFDEITYEKGAAVIRMFENWIGTDKFRDGIRLYLKQHAWGNATAGDFEGAVSKVAGHDVAPEFDSFLDQAGVPEVSVSLDCRSGPKLELTQQRALPIGSSGSERETWQIPLCIAYEADGSVQHECQVLSDSHSEMVLKAAKSCPAWLLANDKESGYYLAGYQGSLLDTLLSNRGRNLTIAERVGVLGDVESLVSAGVYSPQTALRLVPEFADDPNWQVVEASADIAGLLNGDDVPDELRSKAARFIVQVFGRRAVALGWTAQPDEKDDTRLLRRRLVPFVASLGEQQDLIDQAKNLAGTWLKSRSGISPEMIKPVLDTAAEFGNRELFNVLRAAAGREHDHRSRAILIDALGSFRDPALARASLELLLSKDFDPREAFYPLLFGPLNYAQTRGIPFEFVRQNLDALLARLPRDVGSDYAASLPGVGSGFCDVSRRSEIETFFDDRVKRYTGGPRELAKVLEQIDLCIAGRKALAPDLAAFLKHY